VAGLVAITPACAFVGPSGAIAIGISASLVCYAAVTIIKPRMGYDDSLDVFGVHGVGGAWGAIATGLFLAEWGLQDGVSQGEQIVKQLISVGFTAVYAGVLAWLILAGLKLVMGDLRVSAEDEHQGLDLSQHSETAYSHPG
jgi:Amt family ammonium transporter